MFFNSFGDISLAYTDVLMYTYIAFYMPTHALGVICPYKMVEISMIHCVISVEINVSFRKEGVEASKSISIINSV
jgi:hypothetical protein